MNYYIADPHFGHNNIIKLCNRPFHSVEEMNTVMMNNWNSRVMPDDDVYIVGDFAYRSDKAINILDSLNGKKHLVIGNHDKKNLKSFEFRNRFVEIADIITVNENGIRIVLCHYPMTEWEGMYREAWHFFGHIHNNENEAQKIMRTIPKAVNVGAELIGYTPRTANELMSKRV